MDVTLDHNAIKFVVSVLAESFKSLREEDIPEVTEKERQMYNSLDENQTKFVQNLKAKILEETNLHLTDEETLILALTKIQQVDLNLPDKELIAMVGLGYTGDLGNLVYEWNSSTTDKEISQKFYEYKNAQYEASLITLKTLDENLVGVQEVYNALNSFYNGDYSEVALSTLSVVAKKVPGGKQIIEKAEKTFNSLAGSQLTKDAKEYLKDIENITGSKIPSNQKNLLNQNLKENKYTRLTVQETVKNRKDFNNNRRKLKQEWQNNTGQKWPKDPLTGKDYEAHHIIENKYGGPNKWWNLHPARGGKSNVNQHQSGIHQTDSIKKVHETNY